MINTKKSGFLVKTKDEKIGRTIHEKRMVNGKVPVYLATEIRELEGGFKFPVAFSETATLFAPSDLTQIGFID